MSFADNTSTPSSGLPVLFTETINSIDANGIVPLLEIHEQTTKDTMNDSTEESDGEIQEKSMENMYLSNDDLTSPDFINELKMYGFPVKDEFDVKLS